MKKFEVKEKCKYVLTQMVGSSTYVIKFWVDIEILFFGEKSPSPPAFCFFLCVQKNVLCICILNMSFDKIFT